jgi:hypothetical protein
MPQRKMAIDRLPGSDDLPRGEHYDATQKVGVIAAWVELYAPLAKFMRHLSSQNDAFARDVP